MLGDKYRGLEKAYSSQLRLEKRDGKDVIVKKVDAQERENELFFHRELKQIGLPAMEVASDKEGLAIAFIPDAETLGDHETPELFDKLGAELRKLHGRLFDQAFTIDANGERQVVDWGEFMKKSLDSAIRKQEKSSDLDQHILGKVREIVTKAIPLASKKYSLIHGDLHSNNVLIKDSSLLLFDKAYNIASGDSLYDMALFAINLPGAVYQVGKEQGRDVQLMKALVDGYGFDFTKDRRILDAYVLLRCVERWPSPFEVEIPEIINRILQDYNSTAEAI